MIVDVIYPVRGGCVHVGYSYPLFAALCGAWLLKGRSDVWVGPIERVRPIGAGLLALTPDSQIRLRAPSDQLGFVGPLQGRYLVGGHMIELGRPTVRMLAPSPTLHAELVTFAFAKGGGGRTGWDDERWAASVRSQLPTLRPDQIVVGGKRAITIADRQTFGRPVELRHLHDDIAIDLQSRGIGGRRHFGAGVWVPGPLPVLLHRESPRRRRIEVRP